MKAALLIVSAISSISTAMTASDECNGLNIMGLMTWSADVCLNAMEEGAMTSHMIECDADGEGYIHFWNLGHCQGEAMMSLPLSLLYQDWMSNQTGGAMMPGIEMICDGVDCPYAKVRSHNLNGTDPDTLIMDPEFEDGFEDGSEDESEDGFEFSSTEEPNWGTTTDFVYSTLDGSSSGEEWEDFIDCDANEFGNWEEAAVALNDCFQYNDSAYFVDYVCQDGEFTMEYYLNADCLGSALHSEPHFAHEGICPLVDCSPAVSAVPETTESDCSGWQLEGHFDENVQFEEERLEIELGHSGTVYIATCDSWVDTVVHVYDDTEQSIGSYDDDNCGNMNENIAVVLEAGYYSVLVEPFWGAPGHFHLEVSLCPFDYDSAASASVGVAMAVVLVMSLLG